MSVIANNFGFDDRISCPGAKLANISLKSIVKPITYEFAGFKGTCTYPFSGIFLSLKFINLITTKQLNDFFPRMDIYFNP